MTIVIDEIAIIKIMIGMMIGMVINPFVIGPIDDCIEKIQNVFTKKKTKEEIEQEKLEARLRHEKIYAWLRRHDEEMDEKLKELEND